MLHSAIAVFGEVAPPDCDAATPLLCHSNNASSIWETLQVCSACAGDYEDPDATAWHVDTEIDDGNDESQHSRQDADEQSGRNDGA